MEFCKLFVILEKQDYNARIFYITVQYHNNQELIAVKEKRPINIDVTRYRFPAVAIVSILHRISGVVIFLFLPLLLWMLDKSLQSPAAFQNLQQFLTSNWGKFWTWTAVSAVLFHLATGVRHLLMDIGVGEKTKRTGTIGAYIAMVGGAVLIILAGVWLW